jgi:hypothetical protein
MFHHWRTVPVLVPGGFYLKPPGDPVIVHRLTGHEMMWRDNRWIHRAGCPCWKRGS